MSECMYKPCQNALSIHIVMHSECMPECNQNIVLECTRSFAKMPIVSMSEHTLHLHRDAPALAWIPNALSYGYFRITMDSEHMLRGIPMH